MSPLDVSPPMPSQSPEGDLVALRSLVRVPEAVVEAAPPERPQTPGDVGTLTPVRPSRPRTPGRRSRRAASFLRRSGVLSLLRAGRRLRSIFVPILGYHRVWNLSSEPAFDYDLNLISADTASFRQQMQFLLRHYDPIRLSDLMLAIEEGEPLPPRPVVVTFDDGFEDNYTHAYPVLRELGMPATMFVSTGLISSDVTFWFDRVSQLILANPGKEVGVGLDRVVIPADREGARFATDQVLRLLKRVTNRMRLETLAEWEQTLGPAAGPGHTAYSRPMTWDQIREMASEGIEFGSHTVTHPVLTRCDDAELEYELTASRDALASELGQVPVSISFPVGGAAAFDERVIDMARRAGYRIAASYIHGMNAFETLDRFALRRIHVERYHDMDYFASMLEYPEWFQ